MRTVLDTPAVDDLPALADTLATWQVDDGPVQLHPGDRGWHSQRGADRTAVQLRTWARGGRLVGLGMLDGPQLLRMAFDPAVRGEEDLAEAVAADLDDPARGVLEAGAAAVEARGADALNARLAARGWVLDEPWTPLHLDLAAPVPDAGLRVEEIGVERAGEWVPVHWSAFRGTPFTDADRADFLDRYAAMVAGPFGARARSLIGYEGDTPVAVTTVWSAGPGRPGLVEPMAVHRDHHRRGHGAAITRAGARVLRDLGASGVLVCTPTANAGAVATYVAAGFTERTPVRDLARPA